MCEHVFEGHTTTIRSIAVHGDVVVSASYDFDARVWNLEQTKSLHVLKGHTAQVYSITFDGHRIVTGSLDQTARLWDPVSGYASFETPTAKQSNMGCVLCSTCQAVLGGYESLVGQLQLLPSALVTGDSAGKLCVWSLGNHSYSKSREIDAHGNPVASVVSDGSKIVSGGSDGKIRIWDCESGEMLRALVNSESVWKVGLLKDGVAAVFSKENKIYLQVSHLYFRNMFEFIQSLCVNAYGWIILQAWGGS